MDEITYDEFPLVYILEEGVLGVCTEMGTYASQIKFFHNGVGYDVILENDEFTVLDEDWITE